MNHICGGKSDIVYLLSFPYINGLIYIYPGKMKYNWYIFWKDKLKIVSTYDWLHQNLDGMHTWMHNSLKLAIYLCLPFICAYSYWSSKWNEGKPASAHEVSYRIRCKSLNWISHLLCFDLTLVYIVYWLYDLFN